MISVVLIYNGLEGRKAVRRMEFREHVSREMMFATEELLEGKETERANTQPHSEGAKQQNN